MNPECEQLFNLLQRMKPSRGAACPPTLFQKRLSHFARLCLGLSAILFFALCLLALFLKFIYLIDESWFPIILRVGVFSIGLAALSGSINVFLIFADLTNFRKMALNNFTTSIQHDLWAVAELFDYSTETLGQTQRYLNLKIERTKNKLQLFIGGSEKLALISLVGIGYSVYKEISGDFSNLLFYPLAFLIGLVLGGLLLNIVMQRDIYHRELVDLTLEYKLKNQRPQHLYNQPSLSIKTKLTTWKRLLLAKFSLKAQRVKNYFSNSTH